MAAAYTDYPAGNHGSSYFAGLWDCACSVNDGFHYTGDWMGVTWGFSPLSWDFKLFSVDACPNDAPDCLASGQIGPFSINLGC